MLKQVHTAHNAIWAIWRGVIGWLYGLPRHKGSLRALKSHLHAWWRLRDGRRYIVRADKSLPFGERWHP